jgi:hypothetical protein
MGVSQESTPGMITVCCQQAGKRRPLCNVNRAEGPVQSLAAPVFQAVLRVIRRTVRFFTVLTALSAVGLCLNLLNPVYTPHFILIQDSV